MTSCAIFQTVDNGVKNYITSREKSKGTYRFRTPNSLSAENTLTTIANKMMLKYEKIIGYAVIAKNYLDSLLPLDECQNINNRMGAFAFSYFSG